MHLHTRGHEPQRPQCMDTRTEWLTIDIKDADHGDSMGVLANRAVDFVNKPVEQAGVECLGQGIPVVHCCLHIDRTNDWPCRADQKLACKQRQQITSANSSRQSV